MGRKSWRPGARRQIRVEAQNLCLLGRVASGAYAAVPWARWCCPALRGAGPPHVPSGVPSRSKFSGPCWARALHQVAFRCVARCCSQSREKATVIYRLSAEMDRLRRAQCDCHCDAIFVFFFFPKKKKKKKKKKK